jgi:hypothetical protein
MSPHEHIKGHEFGIPTVIWMGGPGNTKDVIAHDNFGENLGVATTPPPEVTTAEGSVGKVEVDPARMPVNAIHEAAKMPRHLRAA